MEELKKAISEVGSALLVLPNGASDRDYLAALGLQKIAPDKIRLLAPSDKEATWEGIFGTPETKKEFAIVIDTSISPVDELRYEKEDGKLIIYLAHRRPFDRKAIELREHIPPADLIITLGFASREEAELFIAGFPKNEPYRHINIGNGAGALPEKLSSSRAGLLGRLMARSRQEAELDILWSFVTRDDFTKTLTRPEDITDLLNTLHAIAEVPRVVIVFWQSPQSNLTEGIVWSLDQELIRKLGARLGNAFPEKNYCPLPNFTNFIEAETATRKLLREHL